MTGVLTTRGDQLAVVVPAAGRPRAVAGGGRVVSTSALLLWEVLTSAYARLGFEELGDEAFRAVMLARILEPTSKADVPRVLRCEHDGGCLLRAGGEDPQGLIAQARDRLPTSTGRGSLLDVCAGPGASSTRFWALGTGLLS